MARINIDDSLFIDNRFRFVQKKEGDDTAIGQWVRLALMAQKYWIKNELIPFDEFELGEFSENFIKSKLVVREEDGYYLSGSRDHFGWLLKQRKNGEKGGRPRNKFSNAESVGQNSENSDALCVNDNEKISGDKKFSVTQDTISCKLPMKTTSNDTESVGQNEKTQNNPWVILANPNVTLRNPLTLTPITTLTQERTIVEIENSDALLKKTSMFEKAWEKYPKKDGRKQAFKSFCSSVKTNESFEKLLVAIENYKTSDTFLKGFVKNGSTFFANWGDWVNPDPSMKKSEQKSVINDDFDGKKILHILRNNNSNEVLPEQVKKTLTEKELDFISSHGGRNRLGTMREYDLMKLLRIT